MNRVNLTTQVAGATWASLQGGHSAGIIGRRLQSQAAGRIARQIKSRGGRANANRKPRSKASRGPQKRRGTGAHPTQLTRMHARRPGVYAGRPGVRACPPKKKPRQWPCMPARAHQPGHARPSSQAACHRKKTLSLLSGRHAACGPDSHDEPWSTVLYPTVPTGLHVPQFADPQNPGAGDASAGGAHQKSPLPAPPQSAEAHTPRQRVQPASQTNGHPDHCCMRPGACQ